MKTGLNRVTLTGHLETDPRHGVTHEGVRVANLRIAITDIVRAHNKPHVEYFDVAVFREGAVTCANLRRGDRVHVEGVGRHTLHTRDGVTLRTFIVRTSAIEVIAAEHARNETDDTTGGEAA